MMTPNAITVQTTVNAPIEKVWACWNQPEHIIGWAFASDDWEALNPENDLCPGGKFKTTLSAKDKSFSFDFAGTYTDIKEHELIEYDMDDGRHVRIEFSQGPNGVEITEIFDPESQNPIEMQKAGWQAFLDNFKKYAEAQ